MSKKQKEISSDSLESEEIKSEEINEAQIATYVDKVLFVPGMNGRPVPMYFPKHEYRLVHPDILKLMDEQKIEYKRFD